MPVALTNHGLNIDGRPVPVYSGTVHYWRLERDRWPYILDQVKALGFEMVETYVPWAIHETAAGVYDWGTIDDRKDVDAFMRLCEEKGLWLIVRPGPLINAELTDFGFPEWVLLDPDVQAKTASGSIHFDAAWGLHPPRPFPVPSYASEKFYELVGGWFDAICPVIARHLAPNGCVVTVQSDNETCYLFHDQPYATDYSDASLRLYRSFLREKYGSIDALSEMYGERFTSFGQIEPPRDCGVEGARELPLHLDWLAYKEYQIRHSIARIARMLRERGITGVPLFHDIAWQMVTPLDVSRMESDPEIDWVGMNLYCNKEEYATVARRMRFLAGATRLPFVPEFGCGLWSHHRKTFMPAEHEFVTLSAYMNGVKAVNFYMLVERERWQGSPITRHGDYRPEYVDFYREFAAFLERYPLWEFERERGALLMFAYDLGRHTRMLTTLNVGHADLLGLPKEAFEIEVDFGLRADIRREASFDRTDSWLRRAAGELTAGGTAFDMADTHIDPARLDRYPTIYLQSVDFMDPGDQANLLNYVEDGGRLVVGPEMPRLDPLMRQSEVFARFLDEPGRTEIGIGQLIWSDGSDLAAIASELSLPPEYRLASGPAELAVLRRGDQTLLFLANPTELPVDAAVLFEGARAFRSVWRSTESTRASDRLPVEIAPYSVRVFEVECAGAVQA
ncbi:MAG TPA: beta-galactosidase [Thermomicrobiales bacterium]|nr:beta-galactosidase [Thermomicrobiales bacterium]